MTIQQLIYAIEISSCHSFNQAAAQLYISQSTLSKAISALEDELGITIFERSKRGVELTAEGAVFVNNSQNVVRQFRALRQMWSPIPGDPYNYPNLHIASIHSSFVTEAYIKLCKRYADVSMLTLSLQTMLTPQVIEKVECEECDFGIIWFNDAFKETRMRSIEAKGLAYTCLYRSSLNVLLNKDDPLCQKPYISQADLEGYTYISFVPCPMEDQLSEVKTLDEFNILSSRQHFKTIVSSERRIALTLIRDLPAFTFAYNQHVHYADSYSLRCVPLKNPECYTEVGYIIKKGGTLSSFAGEFLSMLKEEIENNSVHK